MICFPMDNKPDWRRPPLMTIILILINCLVFVAFQLDDDEEMMEVTRYYFESGLSKIELPHFHKYVLENYDASDVVSVQEAEQKAGKERFELLLYSMLRRDGVFLRRLENSEIITSREEIYSKWHYLHGLLQNRLEQSTVYRYGIKPAKPDAETYITSMFLHGGFMHLLGNMIFLFLFGYIVEMAMGWKIYIPAYIVAGIGSGLLYVVMDTNSAIPGVGASGAIAGLAGMYTALYGLRKVRFFVFLFVYFDSFRLPAIVMLPVWLGYEFYNHYFVDDGINNLAHAGGYISGAIIAVILRLTGRSVNEEYLDSNLKKEEISRLLAEGQNHLARLEFDRARVIYKKLEAGSPANQEVLRQLFNISKLGPATEDLHRYANKILMLSEIDVNTVRLQRGIFNEYIKLTRPAPQLKPEILVRLATRFAKNDFVDEAVKIAAVILKNNIRTPAVADMLVILIEKTKARMPEKAQAYRSFLQQVLAQQAVKNGA